MPRSEKKIRNGPQGGSLTGRLVSEAAMTRALVSLLADASHWTICIKRWEIDLQSGERRSPALLLRQGDELFGDNGDLDDRIRKCRGVVLFVTWDDQSAITVGLN